MVGQPAARPDANLESLWKSEQDTTPEPYIFLKLDDKAVPTRGRSWVVRDACSSNRRCSTFFFKIVWAFYGSDLTGFYQSFVKVILKSGSAAGIIEKSRKRNACDQLWDAYCRGKRKPSGCSERQHPPFFSKMRTFFKNRPPWYMYEI